MKREGEAVWSGLSEEGLRMTAAAVLRRLGRIAGEKPPLAVLAGEGVRGVVEQVAGEEGWKLVSGAEAVAVLVWDVDRQLVPGEGWAWLCRIGPSRKDAGPEWERGPAGRLPGREPETGGMAGDPAGSACCAISLAPLPDFALHGYFSVNQVFARLGRWLRLPGGMCAMVSGLWVGWGLDERAGRKMARLGVPGMRESYWASRGTEMPWAGGARSWDVVCEGLATFGWTGLVPLAGALLASVVTALAGWLSWPALTEAGVGGFRAVWAGVAVAATAGCVLTEAWAARRFLTPDPREFVLDETAGMAVTLLFLPEALCRAPAGAVAGWFVLALCAFRLFDMWKIGVRWIERRDWKGAIVWDDLLAGIYAGLVTALAAWLAGVGGG